MKHPTPILKLPLPIIFVVLAANLQSGFSQTCPFDPANSRAITLEGKDVDSETVPLFSELTEREVVSVKIGSHGTFEGNNTDPGLLLNVAFTQQGDKYDISLFPNQPRFGDEVNYHGYVGSISGGPADELQIEVQREDGGGTEILQCMLILTIEDTNNLEPYFNTSKPEDAKLDFEFNVTTAWDKKGVQLNWKPDDWIKITDWDRTKVEPKFEFEPQDVPVKVNLTELEGAVDYANVWEVKLFVIGDLVEKSYDFKIIPFDGVNRGDPLHVVLNVEEVSLFEPVFTSLEYSTQLSEMPEKDKVLDITPTCVDPDDLLNGRVGRFTYTLSSEDGVTDYLDFDAGTNILRFKNEVPTTLMGTTKTATITATQEDSNSKTSVTSKLHLTFPLPRKIKFPDHIHVVPFPTWPTAGQLVTLPEATGDLPFKYDFGRTEPPSEASITRDDNVITFNENLDQDMLGEFKENRMVIFDFVATYDEFPDLEGVITVVFTFPRDDGTTENPTTSQDCATTGNPTTELTTECDCGTTEITEISCPTELPTTPCEQCEPTTPPDCNTTPVCPEPTTCEPVTGNPTTEYSGTTEGCPVCGTTETSDVTCGTSSVDPTGGTSEGPCDTTCPTLEPCEGSSSEVPCTTPEPCDCSTTREPCDCDSTCPTPEPCDSSPSTCPTPEPCDCEGTTPCDSSEDCSTTGLLVAVITTSVLCVCSIVAGGYCLWLLRKATLDPTKLARDSFLHPEASSPPSPPPDVEVHAQDYKTPHRFSFGDGTNEYSSGSRFGVPPSGGVEPGFANPNFTNDMGATPVTVDPVPNGPPPEPKTRRKSSIKPPKDIEPDYEDSPKKSNMKVPKEIEPDYEEVVSTPDPVASDGAKQSRVLFAPEDEYISIDGGSNDVVGGGGSDVEDERL